MDGVAWVASPAKKFGDNSKQAGHPTLLAIDDQVWLVWREIGEGKTSILGTFSDDGGKNWGAPKVLAETADKADYPQLLRNKNTPFLLWNTHKSGLQVLELK